MSAKTAWLTLALVLACGGVRATAQQKCPVAVDLVDLSYNHQGGASTPQLRARFRNGENRRIASAVFRLSILDSDGNPRIYPNELVYTSGLDAGKQRMYTWYLAPEEVDIHRTGVIIALKKVRFDDDSSWADDGSESCQLTLDYHAK